MAIRKFLRQSALAFPSLLLALTFCGNVFAVPITFVHTGSGSGSIDGTSFTDATFTITAVGDTDNRQSQDSFALFIDHDSASIEIDGIGSFDFVTGTRTFINIDLDVVGFSRAGIAGSDLYNGPADVLLDGWDMLSSIGPISGTAYLLQWTLSDVLTDAGVLVFNDEGSIAATFQATVNQVPEPATLALFGLGLAGIGVMRRKKLAA